MDYSMIREAFYNLIDIENFQRIFIQKRIDELKNQLNNLIHSKKNLNQKVRM